MADIKFTPKARNANAVSDESFENGSMIVATDTGELYVDYNGARMRIGDVITLDTESQRLATLAPLPKLYWVAETSKLWRFANDWVCVNPDDIEADTVKADIVQAGRRYYNVATVSSSAYVYEIVIKTRIPKLDQASAHAIYLYGICANNVVNTMFSVYWQDDSRKFAWRNMVQAGSIEFEGKVFTYEDGGTEYIGIALLPGTTGLGAQTSIYYPRFQVDFTDLIGSIRDYSKGWTVELNTVKDSTSIIPQTNLMDCIESKINSDISGSATSLATPRTIALTGGVTGTATAFDGSKNIQIPVTAVNPNNLSNAVPVTKGGTGATSAANARAALELARTRYTSIATTTSAGWYRIASTAVGIGMNYANVYLDIGTSGRPSQVSFTASTVYGYGKYADKAIQLSQDCCAQIYDAAISKVRIVYPTGQYGDKCAYLEMYKEVEVNSTVAIQFRDCKGWSTIYNKPVMGEIPEGYTAKELVFVPNAIVADKFVGSLTGTSTNSEQLAGVDGELYTCSYVGRIANESDAYYKNLDDAIRHGGYITSGTPGEINCPIPPGYNSTSKLYGKLWVDVSNGTTGNSNNWVWQTWQSTTGAIYRRQQINGGDWTDWVAIATGGLLYPPDNAGINSLGTPTITEISCIPEMLADRLQFFPATKCMAETSTDGTSWTTKTVSASQWNSLLCCNPSYLAGLTWDNGTQLRLTFTYNTYVMLSMLYLYVATGSRLKVVVERYRNSTQDWVELASMGGIVGQPQHVSLWHDAVRFTNTANDSYSSQVRVTLIHEGNATDTPKLDMLRWKGGYPAVNPNIYNWDPNKNVTFPMTVTAANFKGYWEWLLPATRFNENSTTTVPTCKQIADYVKSLIGG